MLLERPGDVVLREEIRERLWPDNTTVEFENSINTAVQKLREVFGDSAREPQYIETVPTRGYRFLANIDSAEVASGAPAAAPVQPMEASSQPQPQLSIPASRT